MRRVVARIKTALEIFPTFRYAKEWLKWKLSGGKYRTKEEIEQIWKTCSECDRAATIDEQEFQCTECSCFIHRSEQNNFNKAAWTSTECPLKKWLANPPR